MINHDQGLEEQDPIHVGVQEHWWFCFLLHYISQSQSQVEFLGHMHNIYKHWNSSFFKLSIE